MLKKTAKVDPIKASAPDRGKQPDGRTRPIRNIPIKRPIILEELPPEPAKTKYGDVKRNPRAKTENYKTIEVTGSTGKRYRIVVPAYTHVPKIWEWDQTKFKVADMIAEGYPLSQIAREDGFPSTTTIYAWLEHPEFREHVDGLVMETGFANKRERISGLSRVARKIFDKIIDDFDDLDLTDKNTGAILQGLTTVLKQVAQEKEEFIEESKVTQDTTVKGNITLDHKIEQILATASEDTRQQLEQEFDSIGDDIIRKIVGGSE